MLASIILAAAFAALGTNGVDGACGPKGRRITLALLGDSITNCGYQDRLMKRMHGAGYAGYTPVGTHTGFSASDEKLPGLAAHDGFGGFCYDTFLTRYQFAEDELMNVQAKAEYEQMKALGVQKVERKDWRRVLLKSPLVRYENGRKTVDVKGWLDRVNGGEPPDYVVIQLGQNGVFAQTDGSLTNHVRDVQLAGAEALLAALRKEAPDAVYAFTTALPGSEDDTHWKANYGEKHTKAQGRRNFAYFNAELRKWIAAKKDPVEALRTE